MTKEPFACPTCHDIRHQSFVRSYCLGASSSGQHHVVLGDAESGETVMVVETWNCDLPSCSHGSHTHVRHDESSEAVIRPWDDCRKFAERTNG